ncbi:MAG: hypothetical protein JNM84_18765 [Planctomycetes bacterium]|nr:hypothetical protein [Planctomycetota bacterium]
MPLSRVLFVSLASLVSLPVALAAPATALAPFVAQAQDEEALKKEYRERREKLGKFDLDGHLELARWCSGVGLKREYKSQLNYIVKEDPEHAATRKELGQVKFDGQWVAEKDLEALKKKKEEDEYKAKGWTKYNNQWVDPADIPNLKKGLVKVDGRWLTAEEKGKLDQGWVFHEGELLPPDAGEKLKQGLFPVEGGWVNEDQADTFHAKWATPWQITEGQVRLRTNIKRKVALEKVFPQVKLAYRRMKTLFGGTEPSQPLDLYYLGSINDFNKYAETTEIGAESSNYGAYLDAANEKRPAIALNDDAKMRHHVGYAIGLAYMDRVKEAKVVIPVWFQVAVAGYNDRFHDKTDRKWLIENSPYITGGLGKYADLFETMDPSRMEAEPFLKAMSQLGLLVAYFVDGGNAKHTQLFQEAMQAVMDGKGADSKFKAIAKAAKEFDESVGEFLKK